MALSERLREAQARRRRAEERPGYLRRVQECTGRALREDELLSDDEVSALVERHRALTAKAKLEGSERRTLGLSAQEAQDLADHLCQAIGDRVMVVGCAGPCPVHARIPLHEVLGALPRYMAISGFVGLTTDDGGSNLAIDLLLPGDYGNRHPEGSCELVLRGPLFDGVELPERFTAAPYSA